MTKLEAMVKMLQEDLKKVHMHFPIEYTLIHFFAACGELLSAYFQLLKDKFLAFILHSSASLDEKCEAVVHLHTEEQGVRLKNSGDLQQEVLSQRLLAARLLISGTC